MSEFAEWLEAVMRRDGYVQPNGELNRSTLGRDLTEIMGQPVTPSSLGNYFRFHARPSYARCVALARLFHTDRDEVLRLAGYDPGEEQTVSDAAPEWLCALLAGMTEYQYSVIAATARALRAG